MIFVKILLSCSPLRLSMVLPFDDLKFYFLFFKVFCRNRQKQNFLGHLLLEIPIGNTHKKLIEKRMI